MLRRFNLISKTIFISFDLSLTSNERARREEFTNACNREVPRAAKVATGNGIFRFLTIELVVSSKPRTKPSSKFSLSMNFTWRWFRRLSPHDASPNLTSKVR